MQWVGIDLAARLLNKSRSNAVGDESEIKRNTAILERNRSKAWLERGAKVGSSPPRLSKLLHYFFGNSCNLASGSTFIHLIL